MFGSRFRTLAVILFGILCVRVKINKRSFEPFLFGTSILLLTPYLPKRPRKLFPRPSPQADCDPIPRSGEGHSYLPQFLSCRSCRRTKIEHKVFDTNTVFDTGADWPLCNFSEHRDPGEGLLGHSLHRAVEDSHNKIVQEENQQKTARSSLSRVRCLQPKYNIAVVVFKRTWKRPWLNEIWSEI